MNKFVGRLGLDFDPHAIRKINVKVILDTDPRAMELAVRSGGWADDRMVRKTYGQKQHDKSQLMIKKSNFDGPQAQEAAQEARHWHEAAGGSVR